MSADPDDFAMHMAHYEQLERERAAELTRLRAEKSRLRNAELLTARLLARKDERIAELERETAAWRGIAGCMDAAKVPVRVFMQNGKLCIGHSECFGSGETIQEAALDLAVKLGLLQPEAKGGEGG